MSSEIWHRELTKVELQWLEHRLDHCNLFYIVDIFKFSGVVIYSARIRYFMRICLIFYKIMIYLSIELIRIASMM